MNRIVRKLNLYHQGREGDHVPLPYGDMNGDYVVNVLDVVLLVNYIISAGANAGDFHPEANPDINGDGSIDVIDVVQLVNYITAN
tara:strand:+ start:1763 stop:2017 length:255 start_codon:yes stop_codon:yes gene_type:complete